MAGLMKTVHFLTSERPLRIELDVARTRRAWVARRLTLVALTAACLSVMTIATPVRADEPGQPLLDEAMGLKLDAKSSEDLDKVVKLCKEALAKGLDADGQSFAKGLATGALFQQAEVLAPQASAAIATPAGQEARTKAIDLLKQSLEIDKEQYDAQLLLARLALLPTRAGADDANTLKQTGRDAADAAVRLAGAEGKKVSEALVLRAALSEDSTNRLADLNQAIVQDKDNAMARMLRAEVRLAEGNQDEALADLKVLIDSEGGNPAALRRALSVLLEQEKFDEANALIDAYLTAHADDAGDLRQVKSQLLLQQGKTAEALAEIEKVLEKTPDDDRAMATRVDILRALDRAKEAVEQFEKLIAKGRMTDKLRMAYADLLIEAEQYDKAKRELDRVLRRNADLPEALFARSRANLGLKKFDNAILDLQGAIDQLGEEPSLIIQLAFYYEAAERPRRAIELFGEAIELLKTSEVATADRVKGEALRGRGDSRLSIGDHAGAVADYDEALKLIPANDGLLNNLAWVLATSPKDDVRNGSRAIELAKKACEVSEYKKPHILSTLAAAYAESGDFEKAREWSEKAVKMSEEIKDDEEMLEHLRGELKGYQDGKSFREIKSTEEKPEIEPTQGDGTDF